MALDLNSYYGDGFAVIRGAVSPELAAKWRAAYDALPPRTPGWNKVAVDGPFPEPLASIPRTPELLDIVGQVFGWNLALYNFRFVVKDKHAREAVFPHQDCGYHVGKMNKASLFVALSEVSGENGAMVFYPGSHNFGYLGDTGEINTGHYRRWIIDYPNLHPGDAVLMNSMTWHRSLPYKSGDDRILADIIYQPTDDPSGIALLRGDWECEPKSWLRGDKVFKWSRSSRLRELQVAADKWEFAKSNGLIWADRAFFGPQEFGGSALCTEGRVADEYAEHFIADKMVRK